MVTSVALAMVLAFEPTEADVMRRPPRPAGEPLLSRFLVWRGTLRVLAAVSGVFVLQLLFTYAPVMQQLFRTEALPLAWGLRIVAVGVGLLMILEVEKAVLRRLGAVA